jgi:hypothetical protein
MNLQEILSRDLSTAEYLLLKIYATLGGKAWLEMAEEGHDTIETEIILNIEAYFNLDKESTI